MTTRNYTKTIPLRYEVDVFVAGGGPAGCAAAVAAAKKGVSVYLAEAQASFGGCGTNGLVSMFMCFGDGVNFLADGIGREVLCRMYGIGCNKQTIAEVGKAMNLPTNQVKDLEARAKSRLKVDGRLRATWKGVGTQVKEAFGFESLSITPDKVGLSMMDTLAEIEALS